MMEASHEIARLCESWWGKLADNTKADQHRYAEQLLELLGWERRAPAETKPILAHLGARSYVLRGEAQTSVAAHFVMPGSLDPPSSIVKRGLDFCETTRLLVNDARGLNLDYAFVTDLYRSYLYDVRTDELLLHADTPAVFRHDMAEALTRANVEHGSLEEVRRPPRSEVARRLREWRQHWCSTIVAESHVTEELASLFIDRILVLRYLFEHDILKRTGWTLRKRFAELIGQAYGRSPAGCGSLLRSLFHDIWLDWKADLFGPEPALDEAIEQDAITVPLLKESALHARSKFSIVTILESFNYGEAAEKARVRMVPDGNEEREAYLAKQTVDTIDEACVEIDLADEGYRAIFHWLDKLVALYQRLSAEFDAREQRAEAPEGTDLFAWSEWACQRPHALADMLQYAVEHGLVVYYSTPRQLRTARLMLCLHVISRYYQTKQRFVEFPALENTLRKRPRLLDSDRKWIFGQARESDEWAC